VHALGLVPYGVADAAVVLELLPELGRLAVGPVEDRLLLARIGQAAASPTAKIGRRGIELGGSLRTGGAGEPDAVAAKMARRCHEGDVIFNRGIRSAYRLL